MPDRPTPPAPTDRDVRGARGYLVVLGTLTTVLLLVAAAMVLRPGAPRRVVIAAGGSATAFHRFGQAYQRILRQEGVTLELAADATTTDGVRRVERPGAGVDVAIVPGGTLETEGAEPDPDPDAIARRHPELVTLGALFSEPLWIFHRLPGDPRTLAAFAGKRIAIGKAGTVGNSVARLVLHTGGLDGARVTVVEMRWTEMAQALARGEVDAALLSAPLEAKPVQELWRTPGVALMSLSQAEAYTRRLPWLRRLTLPAGGLDIPGGVPPRDVTLLASSANLVARRALHPGIVYLLLTAAAQVHGDADAFQRYGEYPTLAYVDLPVHESARRYFKDGPSWLYRYLPFWLASILDRIGVVLPAIAIVLSVGRYASPAYAWIVQNRINRFYGELRYLEDELERAPAEADPESFARRLDAIEERVGRLSAPVSASDRLYTLKSHVQFVRDRLTARATARARRERA